MTFLRFLWPVRNSGKDKRTAASPESNGPVLGLWLREVADVLTPPAFRIQSVVVACSVCFAHVGGIGVLEFLIGCGRMSRNGILVLCCRLCCVPVSHSCLFVVFREWSSHASLLLLQTVIVLRFRQVDQCLASLTADVSSPPQDS